MKEATSDACAVSMLPVGTLLVAERVRGSFLSTEYPGSSQGYFLKDVYAVVLQAVQPRQKVHYFVMAAKGNQLMFGWIQDLTRWTRLA